MVIPLDERRAPARGGATPRWPRRRRPAARACLAATLTLLAVGCSEEAVRIDVQVVDPCDQRALEAMELLSFIPRGAGLDSAGLTTVVPATAGAGQPLAIPLVPDFRLIVEGYASRQDFDDRRVQGLGVSAVQDLTADVDDVSIRVLFSLVDAFHRTTDLADPVRCTQLGLDRFGHTATYLPGSGTVLIVGGARLISVGQGAQLEYPRSVELYDPATGAFRSVAEVGVGGPRAFHTATLLDAGQVLIAGGEVDVSGRRQALETAYIIDAANVEQVRVTTVGLRMRSARTGHRAVRLGEGQVLLVGGRIYTPGGAMPRDDEYPASIEVFDPQQGLFILPRDAESAAVELATGRFGHSATLLASGEDVFVAGGMDENGPVLRPEVVRRRGGAFFVEAATAAVGVGAIFHAAALDPTSGGVILSGGYARVNDAEPSGGLPSNPRAEVEVWTIGEGQPAIGRACLGSLGEARGLHTVSVVDNRALFTGGRGSDGLPTASAEWAVLRPGFGEAACFARPPELKTMAFARAQHAVARIDRTQEVLVVGGRAQAEGEVFGASIAAAEVFSPTRSP